ncbi:hypothetical protein GDO81_024039 [Engystomops pustulosus]|uniref:Uncharacterized protein n=1 Tax=Engystomops pustulosus TaxID=76066 RepID=A0AAV6Z8L7_ENGPU|nr:hypothetical protein GDO81_024039 [Engystomops pustulosus]
MQSGTSTSSPLHVPVMRVALIVVGFSLDRTLWWTPWSGSKIWAPNQKSFLGEPEMPILHCLREFIWLMGSYLGS